MLESTKAAEKNRSLPEKVEVIRPFYQFSDNNFDYFQYFIPKMRNRLSHFGIDDEIELKSLDVLYDLRYLLKTFQELDIPLVQLNKIIKRRNPSDFLTLENFCDYFMLIEEVKKEGKYESIKKDIDEFGSFLSQYVDIEFILNDCLDNLPKIFENWYNSMIQYTEFNKKKIDIRNTSPENIIKKKEEFYTELVPFYNAHREIFDGLLIYQSFINSYLKYISDLPDELVKSIDSLKRTYEGDFKKLGIVTKILNETI